jgi:hypothetical protein
LEHVEEYAVNVVETFGEFGRELFKFQDAADDHLHVAADSARAMIARISLSS